MSAYLTSTARDPRGTNTDPQREIVSHQTIAGVRYDVLSCFHRYAATSEAVATPDEGVEKLDLRRCPDCNTPAAGTGAYPGSFYPGQVYPGQTGA